jgi:hypothetical protein
MRTHRPLAPIERMVDQAAGHHRTAAMIRLMVRVRCPGCGKTSALPAEPHFPDDTALIEIECAVCNPALDGRLLRFLSATGDLLAGDPLIPEQSKQSEKQNGKTDKKRSPSRKASA